jgi:hypothetical protein
MHERCTPECRAAFAEYSRQCREYEERWSDHCDTCHGAGGWMVAYDPSPAGVALSPGFMWEFEPCQDCEGLCPRCAQPMDHNEDTPCPHCGWNWGKSEGDAMPESPECWCE